MADKSEFLPGTLDLLFFRVSAAPAASSWSR